MKRRVLASGIALSFLLSPAVAYTQAGTVLGTITVPTVGISGVVVYLVPVAGGVATPVALEPQTVEMDQRDLRFVPQVIAVTPGSTVHFPNSDPIMHNVFSPGQRTGGFDLGTYPQSERRSFTFREEGAHVILCHVHPEMAAYVVVIASAHRAVVDAAGRFRLEGVAPGTYRLRTWHRRLRTVEQLVSVAASGNVRVDLSLVYGTPAPPRASNEPGLR